MTAEILDACCGGRMWWWDKEHPLAVYMDKRSIPAAPKRSWKYQPNPNWKCEPDIVGDFRSMPFADESFQLVLFDPPHIIQRKPEGGLITMTYGSLEPATADDDLRKGFSECWRVLARGGTLVCKWAGAMERVKPHFPAPPIVGTRRVTKKGLGTRWMIFYKPLVCSHGVKLSAWSCERCDNEDAA